MSSPEGSAPPESYSLPDSFEDASEACGNAVLDCLDRGLTKMRIDFDTSAGDETYTSLRNSMPVARALTMKMCARLCKEETGRTLQVLLPDEGTAALLKREWAAPDSVQFASLGRYKVPESAAACLIVAPTALDVTTLNKLIQSEEVVSSGVPLIVLNPQLVDLTTGALGLEGRTVMKLMASQFQDVYVLKTLVGAALTRTYPGNYAIWREAPEADGGFSFVRDSLTRPSTMDIMDELTGEDESPGIFKEVGRFIKGLQSL